jgi:hypothetical protein
MATIAGTRQRRWGRRRGGWKREAARAHSIARRWTSEASEQQTVFGELVWYIQISNSRSIRRKNLEIKNWLA